MAGQGRNAALAAELARRTGETFGAPEDGEAEPTTLDYVCEWLANARTMKDLASELETRLHFDCSASYVQRWLYRKFGEENVERELRSARTRASHAFADDALSIVDEVATDKVEVARANNRARARQWLAERYNPKQYGQQRDSMTVTLSVGELHLAALQATSRIMPIEQSNRLTSSSQRTDTEDAELVTS